jgi:hypothetical protein
MRFLALLVLLLPATAAAQSLQGHVALPAETFEVGPASGQFLEPVNGVTPPFETGQPIQGFSALVRRQSDVLALVDNGYGGKANSADFVLSVYRAKPAFTSTWEDARVPVSLFFRMSDPDTLLGFPLVADGELYPDSEIKVPETIREGRLLTGGDLDPESFRFVPDGSVWVGDEFGPFLVHLGPRGRVVSRVIEIPGVRGPDNPFLAEGEEPTAEASSGFEGMALGPDGVYLYPVLEKPLRGERPDAVNVYRFHIEDETFDPEGPFARYPLEPGLAVTEFTHLAGTRYLAIERDEHEGPEARHKKVMLVDLARTDDEGLLRKREVLDLLAIPNPGNRGDLPDPFVFPFVTPEALLVSRNTLLFVNDNNYPFSVGRHVDAGAPDDSEFILVHFDKPVFRFEVSR